MKQEKGYRCSGFSLPVEENCKANNQCFYLSVSCKPATLFLVQQPTAHITVNIFNLKCIVESNKETKMGLKGAFEVCSEQVYRSKVHSFGCLNACSCSLISDLARRRMVMKTKKVISGVVSVHCNQAGVVETTAPLSLILSGCLLQMWHRWVELFSTSCHLFLSICRCSGGGVGRLCDRWRGPVPVCPFTDDSG